MAGSKAKERKISLKVFVDKVKKRVVYAEADHTFVDILFGFMTLPLGTIVKLFRKLEDKKFEALGSLNNLYQSLKDFPECYLKTEECKFQLLNPINRSYNRCRDLKLKIYDTESDDDDDDDDDDGNSDDDDDGDSDDDVGCGGVFVSDIATYIVTDDFSVMPYSSAAIFELLTDLGITDTGHLKERKLYMGSEQMLHLLNMALSLDSPLTCYVFHENSPFLDLVCLDQSVTFDHFDLLKKETSKSSKMVLEVSLQKSTGKLLFAEAKEDFVEFVFGFLSIPLGTVIGTLMKGASSVTCMDNIFRSISSKKVGRYLQSEDIKDMLVGPHFGQECPSKHITFPLKGKYGWIKEAFLKQKSGMFFVTDDLSITPSSSRLAINTLKKLNVKVDDVEKFKIKIALEEGLNMLKASLRSKSTLTNIIEEQL